MTRMTFPQDRATFVYQGALQPILTPGRTGIEFFNDAAGLVRADLRWPDDLTVVANSTVYTGTDGLMPEFLGPDDGRTLLYAQVVGTSGLYDVQARFTDVMAELRESQSLQGGHGAPGAQDGVVGSFWLDLDTQELWGPKVTPTEWPINPILIGRGSVVTTSFDYPIGAPSNEVVIDHPLAPYPSVTYTDTENDAVLCDVSYPAPSRVVVSFGIPATGTVHLHS